MDSNPLEYIVNEQLRSRMIVAILVIVCAVVVFGTAMFATWAATAVNNNVRPITYTVYHADVIELCPGDSLDFQTITTFNRDATVVLNITLVDVDNNNTVANITPAALTIGANWSEGDRIPIEGWNQVSVGLDNVPQRNGQHGGTLAPGNYEYRLAAIEIGGGRRSSFDIPFTVVECDIP